MKFGTCGRLLIVLALSLMSLQLHAADTVAASAFQTPLSPEDLDPAAFSQWVDGAVKPLTMPAGPAAVIWTSKSQSGTDGVTFSDSKQAGLRHMRIGWKTPLPVGSVLARAGGQLSVLKSTAAYPGNMADEDQ